MLNLTQDQLKKYFTGFSNAYASKILKFGKYKLLYDYQDKEFLKKIADLTERKIPSDFKFIFNPIYEQFSDSLYNLLKNFNDQEVTDFFNYVFEHSRIKHSDKLNIQESRAITTIDKDGKYKFDIEVPNITSVDILAAEIIHELTHFSSFIYNSNKEDALEYSEVLSMFFEYLMYEELLKEKGKDTFISNRISMLRENFKEMKENLHYAINPSYLEINPEVYTNVLASDLTYIESLEYVLGLIERREDDKRAVNNSIKDILTGKSTCIDEREKLDIETSNYKKLKKMIKM